MVYVLKRAELKRIEYACVEECSVEERREEYACLCERDLAPPP